MNTVTTQKLTIQQIEKTAMIYLDNQATTQIDPRVLAKMVPYMTTEFANCHSSHRLGRKMHKAVEHAREQIAGAIHANAGEIIFTSGATESNNLAIKGTAKYLGDAKPHFVTTRIEHKCVLESMRRLEADGFTLHYVDVDPEARVRMDQLEDLLKTFYDPQANDSKIALVSIMTANNEVGTVQDVQRIGDLCTNAGVLFHTDAAQGLGKVPLDVRRMHIDMMSLSGHKIYGPKGVGALFVNKQGGSDTSVKVRKERVRLVPVLDGGGQENGMRSGTVPVFLAVGFGEAAEICRQDMQRDQAHYRELFDLAVARLSKVPDVHINGSQKEGERIFNNLNVSFWGVEGESMTLGLDDKLCVSSGSACTSASLEPSHVLFSMGLDPELAHTALRIGFGRFTTKDEVSEAMDAIVAQIEKMREMSPMWEMRKKGIDTKAIKYT